MSNAAIGAKQRWNTAHYTQVKVSVSPEIASAFKAACAASNVSMAGALSRFMADYGKTAATHKKPTDYATKRQRRAAVRSLIQQLDQIKDAEERYRDNIPGNLRSSAVFDAADQCTSLLEEAIDILGSIY